MPSRLKCNPMGTNPTLASVLRCGKRAWLEREKVSRGTKRRVTSAMPEDNNGEGEKAKVFPFGAPFPPPLLYSPLSLARPLHNLEAGK